MRRLRESIDLPVNESVAESGITAFFETYRQPDGTIVFPLSVPLRDFGLPDDLAIERDVSVRLAKRRDEENLNDELGISWEPRDGGPFPRFDGRLVVWGEPAAEESFVELDGTYEAPLGAAGEMFDEAVGRTIASRTAFHLLEAIREGVVTKRPSAARTESVK
jgi:hypothetical protein